MEQKDGSRTVGPTRSTTKMLPSPGDSKSSIALRSDWDSFMEDAYELSITSMPDDEKMLLEQSRKLYKAWNSFRQAVPKDQVQTLSDLPDIKYLFTSVRVASETWQTNSETKRRDRLKKIFADLCQNCKDHSNLLSIMPKNDKYISLLAGSLSAIAQASINHQEVAESVSTSIKEISEDMAFWNGLMTEHQDIRILHRYIKELYVVIFEFLTELFINWSKSSFKRFITSFDENAINKLFTKKRERILSIQLRMERETNLSFQRNMKVKIDKLVTNQERFYEAILSHQTPLNDPISSLSSDFSEHLEQTRSFHLSHTQQITGTTSSKPTNVIIMKALPSNSEVEESSSASSTIENSPLVSSAPPAVEEDGMCHKNDFLAEVPAIVDQIKQDMQFLAHFAPKASQMVADLQVHRRLLLWMREDKSSNLWIQGPHGVPKPSQNQLTWISLASLSQQNDIPCILYCCSFDTAQAMSNNAALLRMVSSIATQLVLLLPARFKSHPATSATSLKALQSNHSVVDSWLNIIQALRKSVPRYMHCVIHGIEALEDRSDSKHTSQLLKALYVLSSLDTVSHCPDDEIKYNQTLLEDGSQHIGQVTKVCFTTDGYADCLGQIASFVNLDKIKHEFESF